MKSIDVLENKIAKIAVLAILGVMITLQIFAQDGGLDIEVDIGEPAWYEQPWAWVVGGALFVLILVALVRRKK